jgi:hypothetical protein
VLPPNNYTAGAQISVHDASGNKLMKGRTVPTGQILEIEAGKITDLGTLHFDLVFAGSNVYWETDHMTFTDENFVTESGTTLAASKYYAGLFCKGGGLIGISPSPAADAANATFDPANTPLYVPTSMTPSSASWSSAYRGNSHPTTGWTGSDFADIPRITTYTVFGRENDYIGTAVVDYYLGDICRFITENNHAPGNASGTKWRLPVSIEFGNDADYSAFDASTPNTVDHVGKGAIHSGRTLTTLTPSPFFPTSGIRNMPSGAASTTAGAYGHYWSASAYSSFQLYKFVNNSGTISSAYVGPTYDASSVRCVKN